MIVVRRLIAILKPGGNLALSWRVEQADRRDPHGRLYSAFDKELVVGALVATTVLLDEDIIAKSSGNRIHRVVARKSAADL